MKYITGIHALNLPCSLQTFGDWHRGGIQWGKLTIADTDSSVLGTHGIEDFDGVPEHPGTHKVANHIRAILDMLVDSQFSYAQGMRKDFICNDSLDTEVFEQTLKLKGLPHWAQINDFMGHEYGLRWLSFLQKNQLEPFKREIPSPLPITSFDTLSKWLHFKLVAYCREDSLLDLFEICLLCNEGLFNELSDTERDRLYDTFFYYGVDRIQYLLALYGEDLLIPQSLILETIKRTFELVQMPWEDDDSLIQSNTRIRYE